MTNKPNDLLPYLDSLQFEKSFLNATDGLNEDDLNEGDLNEISKLPTSAIEEIYKNTVNDINKTKNAAEEINQQINKSELQSFIIENLKNIYKSYQTFNNIINISEVSNHISMVINIYRLVFQNRFRE